VALLVLCGAAGYGVTRLTSALVTQSFATRITGTAVSALVVAGVLFFLFRLVSGDWFHPLAFPLAYVTLTLIGPVLFILATGTPIGSSTKKDLTPTLLAVFVLTVVGMAVGSVAALVVFRGRARLRAGTGRQGAVDYALLRRVGRSIILLTIVLRASEIPGALSHPYGFGAVIYNVDAMARAATNILVFAAVILISISNAQLHRRVLLTGDYLLFGAFVFFTLLTGNRGELVGPALFALYVHHAYVRPMRLWRGILLGLVVVAVFTAVGQYRVGQGLPTDSTTLASRAMVPVSTPVLVTNNVIKTVPSKHPFTHGSTYLESIRRQLPGPIAVELFGPPNATGSFVYRQLISYTNPNAGFAFSVPSEAYLNFGLAGAFGVAAILGLLIGYAYRRQSARPSRAVHVLYPILIAALPLSLRSDAVQQVKLVLYPMILLALLFRWAAVRGSKSAGPGATRTARSAETAGAVRAGV